MSNYLLGYDIGSSSVKASLVNAETGKCVSSAFYPKTEALITAVQPGWAEQDPANWWENLKLSTQYIINESGVKPEEIAAIGISYQMHGLVCVDKDHNVLRPAIIWCDSRAVPYGQNAFQTLGEECCLSHLLNSPGNFTASKLAWVKENEPEIYEKIKLREALQTTISFYVDRHYITDAQKKNIKSVATFLSTHPDINLIVTGYADIETAYPAYNLRLSQKRAQAVYDMLVDEFGVSKDRLRIDYKGDTVQPYESVNEWNRAVIFFLDRDGGKSQILQSEPSKE